MTCIKKKLIGYERTIDSDFKKNNVSYCNFLDEIDFMVRKQLIRAQSDRFEWSDMCYFLSILQQKTNDFENYVHCLGDKNWLLNDFKSVIEGHCCDECDENKS